MNNTLTSGSSVRSIWQISWPMMLIMIFNFLVGFTDMYVAGLLGAEVQAAVGFVSQLYFLLIIIANAISTGSVALVSRSIGGDVFSQAAHYARHSIIMGVLVSLALSITGITFHREIIALAGFPSPVRAIAETFLQVFAFALGPNYLLIIANGIFRATGEVKKPLCTMVVVCFVNIILDFILVFGFFSFPSLGYTGIAVATSVSLALGMLINLLFLATDRWKDLYHHSWSVSSATVRQIINLGWPAALLQVTWNAGSIILYNILGRLGDQSIIALASISNGLRIEAIIFLPAFALNLAASVLVGQNLGAGHPNRASRLGWEIAFAGAMLMSLLATVIYVWAERCAALLTSNPEVLGETTSYLKINMLSEPFMALSMILGGGLQGAGDTRGSMMVIVVGMWLIRLPLAAAFALILGYGATGVWVAMVISMACQGILMAIRFQSGRWKEMRIN